MRASSVSGTALRGLLRSYGSCVVAYSGGVDSVFLARVVNRHDVRMLQHADHVRFVEEHFAGDACASAPNVGYAYLLALGEI